jgi:hypothetical protein
MSNLPESAAAPDPPLYDLTDDFTFEVWTSPDGRITGVRVTRGTERYGRRSRWRRWLARWFPWLLVRFKREHLDTFSSPVSRPGTSEPSTSDH